MIFKAIVWMCPSEKQQSDSSCASTKCKVYTVLHLRSPTIHYAEGFCYQGFDIVAAVFGFLLMASMIFDGDDFSLRSNVKIIVDGVKNVWERYSR